MGAQVGFMIGSAIGGYVDPEIIQGPRLGDIPVQTSQEGVPRPIVYGAPQPFPGNIIQAGPKVRVTRRERQGKGGPVVESEEVYQTYGIRICEGPATVLTIWRDGKVVFDRTGAFLLDADSFVFQSKIALYTGDEAQLPDPGLESLPPEYGGGAGNVPAYRGTAYMVVYADNLTNTGGRIPNYEFRMASIATLTEQCNEDGLLFWYPLDDASPGGVAREVVHGWDGVYANNTDPVTTAQTVGGGPALSVGSIGSTYFSGFGGYMVVQDGIVPSFRDYDDGWTVSVWCRPMAYEGANGGGTTLKSIAEYSNGDYASGTTDWSMRLRYPASPAEDKNLRASGAFSNGIGFGPELSDPAINSLGQNIFITLTFKKQPGYSTGHGDFRLYVNGALVDEEIDIGNSATLGQDIIVGGGFAFASAKQFIGYIGDLKGYNYALSASEIQAKYLSASADFWENPDAPGSFTDVYGNVYTFCTSRAETGATYLSEVELDIARRVGVLPEQFDVSADTAIQVDGLVLGKPMAAAEALRVLGGAYLRDYPEYDLELHSKPRGGASVVTLTDDNFIDSDEDEDSRRQAQELPRKLNLYFSDPTANYAIVPVPAERTSSNIPSTSVVGVQFPMVFTRNYAKQLAEINLKCMWEEAQGTLNRELPAFEFAYLTPADPITYDNKRWRITRLEQMEGTIRIEAKRDRVSNYSSSATANDVQPPSTPVSSVKGPSVLRVLQLPALRPEDATSGVYIAVTGLLQGWPGADIYLSTDSGVTERIVLTAYNRATMGKLAGSCTSSSEPISVSLWDNQTAESITQAQYDAGLNAFAITSSGTSEVGQFLTAHQDTGGNFDLTDVGRGLLGTTAASHAEGDDFTLLNDALYFLPIDSSYAGQTLIFRAVTRGTAPENNIAVEIVFEETTVIIDGGEVT